MGRLVQGQHHHGCYQAFGDGSCRGREPRPRHPAIDSGNQGIRDFRARRSVHSPDAKASHSAVPYGQSLWRAENGGDSGIGLLENCGTIQ